MEKETLVIADLDGMYASAMKAGIDVDEPVVWASTRKWDGDEYQLRMLTVDKLIYIEQHMRTHSEKHEMIVCLAIPNRDGVLDKIKPVVYTDCDEVYCDCNKEPWPWLELVREATS